MVYTSNVGHVTRVNSLFLGDTYDRLWKDAATRFKGSRLKERLSDHQLNISADVALRVIALERYCPEMFRDSVTPSVWLHTSLRTVAERKELFPKDHDYRRIDFVFATPPHVQEELTEMLTLAGQTVYDWERRNGRFPHCREKLDFLLEYAEVSPTASFIYDRSSELPSSLFI